MEKEDQLQGRHVAEKIKKAWKKPEIYILATEVVSNKSHANVHEATGIPGTPTYPGSFSTPAHNHYFHGTRLQATS